MKAQPPQGSPILLFDGECVLCNRSVLWILRRERNPDLHFAPLDSSTAMAILRDTPWAGHRDSILWAGKDGRILSASDAALAAAGQLKMPWRLLCALRCVPRPIRDGLYGLVARCRKQAFGTTESCALLRDLDAGRLLP